MRIKADWTPAFLKLQKKMNETRRGEWVFASTWAKIDTYNIQPLSLCRFMHDGDYSEYKGDTEDKYISIKTFINFVSIGIADTEYELENNIQVIGAINDDRNITINEVIYYLGWDKNKIEYWELD